jgi:hypothetical protein
MSVTKKMGAGGGANMVPLPHLPHHEKCVHVTYSQLVTGRTFNLLAPEFYV